VGPNGTATEPAIYESPSGSFYLSVGNQAISMIPQNAGDVGPFTDYKSDSQSIAFGKSQKPFRLEIKIYF
jgi:hypothetical protein